MYTVTCHFQFPDGETALATVSVPSPHSDAAVQYAGASDRLPRRFTESDAATLKIWAKHVATETSAKLSVTEAGEYEWWGE